MLIFDTEVVQEVPGWQEGDPQEETERPAQLWDEGDGGEGPDLPLHPHIGGAEVVPDFEVTAQIDRESRVDLTSPWLSSTDLSERSTLWIGGVGPLRGSPTSLYSWER